jgi:lycopene cyclase domain-containing protein
VTYARFLWLFLFPPLAFAAYRAAPYLALRHLAYLLVLTCVVLAWTSPWDNAAVAIGLWRFNVPRTSGFFVGWLPVEEYTFFLLQAWLVTLLLIRRLRERP